MTETAENECLLDMCITTINIWAANVGIVGFDSVRKDRMPDSECLLFQKVKLLVSACTDGHVLVGIIQI
jgi:hypothetical protein